MKIEDWRLKSGIRSELRGMTCNGYSQGVVSNAELQSQAESQVNHFMAQSSIITSETGWKLNADEEKQHWKLAQ